jgi:hypothetical protein
MKNIASPRQMISIIDSIEKKIWEEYDTYKKVNYYIGRWQEKIWDVNGTGWNGYDGVNFEIKYKDKKIDLATTLQGMDDELLLKIACDMGAKTPNIIYAVPKIIGLMANDYKDANLIFEQASKKVYEDPSHAIILASSGLESIIKKILKDSNQEFNEKKTLYDLAQIILKKFKLYPDKRNKEDEFLQLINNIGSGLLSVSKVIEEIRSSHTKEAHGKLEDDYIIKDHLYAHFIINSVATVGLFLINFYEKKYKSSQSINEDEIFF